MSSDHPVVTTLSARALASRRNGAKSRGPRTAPGKARSAENALKHGLCAKKLLVIPEEDAAALKALETALLDELAPVGALQAVLAERVVSAAWRLMRADRMEAEVLEFRRAAEGGLGLALIRDGNGTRSVDTVLRYRNAAMAELLRAQKILQALQAAEGTDTRAQAGPPAAAPARKRRARPRVAWPIEPAKPRETHGLSAERAIASRPAAAPKTQPTREPAPEPRLEPPAPRRSPQGAGDAGRPSRVSAAPSNAAGTERTREGPTSQRVDPRAPQRSAA